MRHRSTGIQIPASVMFLYKIYPYLSFEIKVLQLYVDQWNSLGKQIGRQRKVIEYEKWTPLKNRSFQNHLIFIFNEIIHSIPSITDGFKHIRVMVFSEPECINRCGGGTLGLLFFSSICVLIIGEKKTILKKEFQ